MAHLFGELLRSAVDPARAEMIDVLSEIKTLRQEITGKIDAGESDRYLLAIRFLLDDKAESLREFLTETLGRTLDSTIPALIASQSIEALVEEITGKPPQLVQNTDVRSLLQGQQGDYVQSQLFMLTDPNDEKRQIGGFFGRKQDGAITWNMVARDQVREMYSQFRAALDGVPNGSAANSSTSTLRTRKLRK